METNKTIKVALVNEDGSGKVVEINAVDWERAIAYDPSPMRKIAEKGKVILNFDQVFIEG